MIRTVSKYGAMRFFVLLSIVVGIILFVDPMQSSVAVTLLPFIIIGILMIDILEVVAKLVLGRKCSSFEKRLIRTFSIAVIVLWLLNSLKQLTLKDGLILVALSCGLGWYAHTVINKDHKASGQPKNN